MRHPDLLGNDRHVDDTHRGYIIIKPIIQGEFRTLETPALKARVEEDLGWGRCSQRRKPQNEHYRRAGGGCSELVVSNS